MNDHKLKVIDTAHGENAKHKFDAFVLEEAWEECNNETSDYCE